MSKKADILLLIVLLTLLFLINYSKINSFVVKFVHEKEQGIVERVVDGDTIIVDGKSIRMLGINTPERGEKYYSEAKEFLEGLILNEKIELEKVEEDEDKYHRKLRYIFLNKNNINLIMIEQGWANAYFPSGNDKYADDFYKAWENCLKTEKNLCEKSENKCVSCIYVKELKKSKNQVILENQCSFDCDLKEWIIKGEGRKITEINKIIKSKEELKIETENTWNSRLDSLFVRDEENKLVLYYHY